MPETEGDKKEGMKARKSKKKMRGKTTCSNSWTALIAFEATVAAGEMLLRLLASPGTDGAVSSRPLLTALPAALQCVGLAWRS